MTQTLIWSFTFHTSLNQQGLQLKPCCGPPHQHTLQLAHCIVVAFHCATGSTYSAIDEDAP